MKTMPTYDNEAERLVAVKEAGLETADVTDTIGADEFTSITKEAMDEFGVCTAYIGSIDGTTADVPVVAAETPRRVRSGPRGPVAPQQVRHVQAYRQGERRRGGQRQLG
jgi:hypothetical protein